MREHVGYPVLAQLDLVAQQHMQVLKSMNMYSSHSPHMRAAWLKTFQSDSQLLGMHNDLATDSVLIPLHVTLCKSSGKWCKSHLAKLFHH